MADGMVMALDLAGPASGIEVRRWLLAVGDAPGLDAPVPAERSAGMLSPSGDFVGISPAAWLAALAFFAVVVTAIAVLGWRVQPTEAWPEKPPSFTITLVPAQPTLEPEAAALAVASPPPAAEPPSPPQDAAPMLQEPAPVVADMPPPLPEQAAPAPVMAADIPPPPPTKPSRPRAAPQPHAAAVTTAARPTQPVEQQLVAAAAALPPPSPAPRVVAPPRPVGGMAGNPKPPYPAQAARRGWQGTVLLRVEVSPAGKPVNAVVATSSGHGDLDEAARSTVLAEWRFVPATDGGTPVAGEVNVPILFRLE
jgi:periplasmic protein TonB